MKFRQTYKAMKGAMIREPWCAKENDVPLVARRGTWCTEGGHSARRYTKRHWLAMVHGVGRGAWRGTQCSECTKGDMVHAPSVEARTRGGPAVLPLNGLGSYPGPKITGLAAICNLPKKFPGGGGACCGARPASTAP